MTSIFFLVRSSSWCDGTKCSDIICYHETFDLSYRKKNHRLHRLQLFVYLYVEVSLRKAHERESIQHIHIFFDPLDEDFIKIITM